MAKFEYNKEKVLWNLRLRILEYAVQEGPFIRGFNEIARVIESSEQAIERRVSRHDLEEEYIEAICEEENENIEEWIGMAFLALQIKINRVKAAADFAFGDDQKTFKICGNYESYPYSMIEFIWELANYYKHKDDGTDGRGKRRQTVLKEFGFVAGSSHNLRTAFEKLGVTPYSNCNKLALHVQSWANQVLQAARTGATGK